MKKLFPYLIIVTVLALGMTGHSFRQTAGKRMISEVSWDSGESTATTEDIILRGKCSQVEVDVAENTTNSITFTVAVATEDGGSLFSVASIADYGSTILKATSDASDFDAFLAAEKVTVTVTPSGDPGTTGATVNVGFYLE